MRKKAIFISALIVIALTALPTQAGQVVIGGSSLQSPPPFWEDSYWGITASTQRAFPFTVIGGGPYFAEDLEVAAYYSGSPGSLADFSISLDDNGKPGQPIGKFYTAVITTSQQVVSVEIIDDTVLYSDTLYWLVGQTSQGVVNWNLADNVFDTVAYCVDQGDWVVLEHKNVSAFAILGSPVPEPATFLLFALGCLSLIRKHQV